MHIPKIRKPTAVRSSFPVWLGTFALAAGALAACADENVPGPAIDAQEIAELEARADRAIAAGIPGLVVEVRAGQQTVRIARGVAERTSGRAMTSAHRFRAASLAKSVVASVVLQLVDEGKLALTDTLDSRLPGLVPHNGHATIEHLLRQESGLFNFAEDPRLMAPYIAGQLDFTWTPEQLVALATDHPPVFAPGERFMYSNTNYTLLGLTVQKVTGAALADVVQQRITGPLGMTSSSMATTGSMDAPFAHGYLVGMGPPIDVTGISASSVFGNGNLVSTAADLVTLYRALVAGQVVNPRQLDAMFSKNPNVPPANYAMGLFRWDTLYPCGAYVGHDGGIPGYDSAAYARLDGKRQFAVLVNSLTMESKAGEAPAHQAFSELVQAAACPTPRPNTVSAEAVDQVFEPGVTTRHPAHVEP